MKLNKIFLLFISLSFLTSLTSSAQGGITASIQKEKSQQIHKTESADFGFMDFLLEEDTTENEEDNLFIPFQVAFEYLNNRIKVIDGLEKSYLDLEQSYNDFFQNNLKITKYVK